MKKIMVLGGDERNFYLTEYLNENGYFAVWYASELYKSYGERYCMGDSVYPDMEIYDCVVLPLPLSRDGKNINCRFSDLAIPIDSLDSLLSGKTVFTSDGKVIDGFDYFAAQEVTFKNARFTAVGFLKELLLNTKSDIMGKKALVTGFGRVGKAVSKILIDNGVAVTVAARRAQARAEAEETGCEAISIDESREKIGKFDYIVNTVPFILFTEGDILKSKRNSIFFELAVGIPKGTVEEHCEYVDCKGMPGKHTPQSAGEAIADFIIQKLRE